MVALLDLWLPILLSAVFVFLASSVVHMVLPLHKSDYKKLPNEDALMSAMRDNGVQRGDFVFPCASSMKDMGSPEMLAKFEQGPVGFVTFLPNGPMQMGKSLTQWFLYSLLISAFAGYVATFALVREASYMDAFRLTGTVAIMGYATAYIPGSIWKGLSWTTTMKFAFDGILYGLVTAGTFGWLWPSLT